MTTFFIISGILSWVLIITIIFGIVCRYYDRCLLRREFLCIIALFLFAFLCLVLKDYCYSYIYNSDGTLNELCICFICVFILLGMLSIFEILNLLNGLLCKIDNRNSEDKSNLKRLKAKLYDRNNVKEIIDCNDIDHIDNPCYEGDNVIAIHMRDHTRKLCDDFVFMLEGGDYDFYGNKRIKLITLCGSTRFKEQFLETQKRLSLEGNMVLSVGLFGHSGDEEVWTPGTKEMLDYVHLHKIEISDEIFVINVGGYIGESTKREIAYAESLGKKVNYLEE